MKSTSKNKNTLMLIILVIALWFFYNTFFKSKATPDASADSQNVGSNLVSTFSRLQRVTFNQTLFSSQAYRNLFDFSVDILKQPASRKNPFDIIGRD